MKILFLVLIALVSQFSLSIAEESPVLRLSIRNEYREAPLIRDSLRYTLHDGSDFSINRVSYLISEIAFQTDHDNWLEVESIGFFDAAKGILSMDFPVPKGSYKAIRFKIGLPPELNHSNPSQYPKKHPLNPENNLHWTWSTGYVFMALEGRYAEKDGKIGGYVFHLANDSNDISAVVPLSFTHSVHTVVELCLDLEKVFKHPLAISFHEHGHSSHSRPDDVIVKRLRENIAQSFLARRVDEFTPKLKKASLGPIDLPDSYNAYRFTISRNFPIPELPTDNPLIEERVALGEAIFFDSLLSKDKTISCASCHNPSNAFSDSTAKSNGVGKAKTRRHSMPLFNLAWKESFLWDGRVASLREQVLHPITSEQEMGNTLEEVIERLESSPRYKYLFSKAFNPGKITEGRIGLALENYLLTLVSDDSHFDRALAGKAELTNEEKRGFELFMTEFEPRTNQFGADCFHCHGGALFTDNEFHNNGLMPLSDLGRYEFSKLDSDRYKFANPSLRNVGITAPYMHDGSVATLNEIVAHYSNGFHPSETLNPNLAKHPKDGIQLSREDQRALVAFLEALTDPQYIDN